MKRRIFSALLAAIFVCGSFAPVNGADGASAPQNPGSPSGLCRTADGGILITDEYYKVIWRQGPDGALSLFAGALSGLSGSGEDGAPAGGYRDGKQADALFSHPWSVAPFLRGYAVSDTGNNVIRYMDGSRVVTAAGDGQAGLRDGAAAKAQFSRPTGLARDDSGSLYIADTGNNVIRRLSADGTVSTFAGNGEGCADGALSDARFRQPTGLCWSGGTLYVADSGNHRICKIENGTVATLAGAALQSGDAAFQTGYRNGPAAAARFANPQGITVGEDGSVYIADTGNQAIRRIRDGYVSTLTAADTPHGMDPGSLDPLDPLAAARRPVSPRSMIAYGGLLYAADPFSRHVFRLSTEDIPSFTDVPKDAWYAGAVSFVSENRILAGASHVAFDPETVMTRAMFVTALANLHLSLHPDELLSGTAYFSDVPADGWYAKAVGWAFERGVVKGDGDGCFRPDAPVTREELVTMLNNYAKSGQPPDAAAVESSRQETESADNADLRSYPDAVNVQSYALPAFRWACGAGLISGSGGRLMPAAPATRAETAQIMKNFAMLQ